MPDKLFLRSRMPALGSLFEIALPMCGLDILRTENNL